MGNAPDAKRGFSLARLALLALVGILVASVVADQLVADEALGLNELWVVVGGLGFAVLVEFGVLARRRS